MYTDALDLHTVTGWLRGPNIADWPVTMDLHSVTVDDDRKLIKFGAPAPVTWPEVPGVPEPDNSGIVGNCWLVALVNGHFYAATWDWLRASQTTKGEDYKSLGRDQIRQAPLDASWQPLPGEQVAFFLSTIARDGRTGPVQARSNVVLVTWPERGGMSTGTAIMGEPTSAPTPTPAPEPSPLEARVVALEQVVARLKAALME